MAFMKDLNTGREGERIVKDLLAKSGIFSDTNTTKGELSCYDLACSSFQTGDFTVEVKNDIYAEKSGNIAIEVFNPKAIKNSGLTITEADIWIHIAGGGVYCVGVCGLHKYVKIHMPDKIVVRGGNGNAMLYIYAMMPSVFHRLDTVSSDAVLNIICSCLEDKE